MLLMPTQTSRGGTGSKRRSSPRKTQRSGATSPPKNDLSSTPIKLHGQLGATSNSVLKPFVGGQVASDGFNGRELQIIHWKRAARRGFASWRRKNVMVARALPLRDGLLPTPDYANFDTSQSIPNGDGQNLDDWSASEERQDRDTSQRPAQLALVNNRSSARGCTSISSPLKLCDQAVLHQLPSITAPIRCEPGIPEADREKKSTAQP